MTNEEKIDELAYDFFETSVWYNDVKDALINMAEWKDKQAAAAYCKCCNECDDHGLDICKKLEDFMTIMKEGEN